MSYPEASGPLFKIEHTTLGPGCRMEEGGCDLALSLNFIQGWEGAPTEGAHPAILVCNGLRQATRFEERALARYDIQCPDQGICDLVLNYVVDID